MYWTGRPVCDVTVTEVWKKHITCQICNNSWWHLHLLPTSVYSVDSCYSYQGIPSLQSSSLKVLWTAFTLMPADSHGTQMPLRKGCTCLVFITFKCMIKHIKRKYVFQRCWVLSHAPIINLKKHMKGKQNKSRGFSKIFTIFIVLFSLKVLENFSLNSGSRCKLE